jgi:hypothetical protein
MKRIVLYVAAGFLAGLFCQYALLTPHVFAQSPGQSPVVSQGITNQRFPLANQRFVLADEGHNSVGVLSFDSAGTPVISLTGQFANRLGGRVTRVLCEIRPWYAATPAEAGR